MRPIDDIDVLAIFDNVNKAWDKYRWDSKAFIYRIRRAYDGVETGQVGREDRLFESSSRRADTST